MKALRTGKLLTTSARRTREAGVRVRGAVLDTAQPWRRDAEGRVGRLKVPELVAVEEPDTVTEDTPLPTRLILRQSTREPDRLRQA